MKPQSTNRSMNLNHSPDNTQRATTLPVREPWVRLVYNTSSPRQAQF